MDETTYNDIADWYDLYLRENPIYSEMVLPNVLALAGDIQGRHICDLACGQGWIARELALGGASVTGIDMAENLLAIGQRHEEQLQQGIKYIQGDAQATSELTESSFDGCICVMALMNIPDITAVFSTVYHSLKPGGWFVFAITHPCFGTPGAQWIETPEGQFARVVSGYSGERLWTSGNCGGVRSRVGDYHRTISTYLNALIAVGLIFERMVEPVASDEIAKRIRGSREVPAILLVRAFK